MPTEARVESQARTSSVSAHNGKQDSRGRSCSFSSFVGGIKSSTSRLRGRGPRFSSSVFGVQSSTSRLS
eukprot:1986929-Lingulodinium_polyedra.AAC.1